MSDLPDGWEWATLGDVADSVKNGIFVSRPGKTPNGVPILRISAVRAMQLDLGDLRYSGIDAGSLAQDDALLADDDLLFTRYSGSKEFVGACARVPANSGVLTYPDKLIRVRVPALDSRYVAAAFASPIVRASVEASLRTTAGQVGISGSALKDVRIPIAPRGEQRRIVVALEDGLSRLNAGIANLKSAQSRADLLNREILRATVAENSATGTTATIGDIATVTSGVTPRRSRQDYHENGTIPWITSSQVGTGQINHPERFVTEKALAETGLRMIPSGAILVAMYGEGKTRGRTAELKFPATTNQACAAIILHEKFSHYRQWLKLVLDSRYESNRQLAAGGVQPNLSVGLIKSMSVPLPPAGSIDALATNLAERRGSIGRLPTDIERIRGVAERLRRSLLTEAFAGRLVPQDPNDEPTSTLLERIRMERTIGSKLRRTRRTVR